MMKIVRYKKQGTVQTGILENDKIKSISGEITADYKLNNRDYDLAEVELIAPCQPGKVVCVGLNYRDHAQELNMELPVEPIIFLKPPSAITGPNSEINYPAMAEQVDYEAELAVVIKDKIKNVIPKEAEEHILGYTCFNDVTARDLQSQDGQWTRAKSFDTFAPLGPVIETDLAVNNLAIKAYKNNELKQESNTEQMIFSIPEIVSFVSQVMTLHPEDVVATGTPPGVGEMKPGDRVEVVIEGIGSLQNELKDNL
jgi:2-keto-4-pentenoate hydratase/2-oxohepta-3-ene-1,7-dioic acid hydratase in catechol pathway